ncbi:MAG: cyclic dehypoxanthinyl futalosine synthase [Tenuifilum sp.]|jgi:cyclic dehypoxanthinyl futalosine synthase|uniref:Dehypoxanthine futalosine cyclase n=1 Tax=Tenuifilum thalassicum TaxID=2590900 RepID=A0A7D3XDG3_9BACT|nr:MULTISPECIES: cyclic dehypoxanthinyl futalosine synthase [Tenuifilum]MDI3525994.1 cyclic dehypoxanthinyl futalosine synthase [Tenuifilum sp.]QKG79067.1 dehypoxanthine futalosine cyclase [Tenuifilum thalassicum]
MQVKEILKKALNLEPLTLEEGLILYTKASTSDLMYVGYRLRNFHVPGKKVTWQIDRNVNITNVCVSGCKFCNFHCTLNSDSAYITSIAEYKLKIEELLKYGGDQLLLQGGLHPKLGLDFYKNLFKQIKEVAPSVKLHALGPPEIAFIARKEKMSYREVLEHLIEAGLDSLPGAGAEILVDRVRKQISPGKPDSQAWLDVMAEAHKLGLITSATMMIGHIETIEERLEHLIKLRDLQSRKPKDVPGFLNFIVWTFQDKGTKLENEGVKNRVSAEEYVRTIALSRIMLNNIPNIQASWLTVGVETAQLCLHAGANDFGSIMIEENVVSSAGAKYKMDAYGIQKAIVDAGFIPQLRNQKYEHILLPDCEFSKIYSIEELKGKAKGQ